MKTPRRSRVVGISASVVAATLGCGFLAARGGDASDTLNVEVEDAFAYAGKQLKVLAEDVLVTEDLFTDYTDTDGAWITEKDSGKPIDLTVWTSGMVAGMFWYQYEATKDTEWKTRAEHITKGLEGVEDLDDNDLGFQVLNSFGLGYRLSTSSTDKESYLERVLTGAATLYDLRWAADVPAFWSWTEPSSRPDWLQAVNVDMMMNMEIMLWAAVNSEDALKDSYEDAVKGHAESTWKNIVRSDNSTFHVADFDPDTGDLVDQGTYQGWNDNSTWSRGQAWAVYGYAMVYRFLPEPKFLSMSLGVLKYWDDNLPGDFVPQADYDAPVSATENGKDSSSAAIVASALIELFILTEDPTHLVRAQKHLSALLLEDYYMPDATDGWQSILRRATSKWGKPEVGAVFGDYFLLEAMVRYKRLAPSIVLWEEDEVEVAGSSSDDGGGRFLMRTRKLQTLQGGEFCAVKVSSTGILEFADPDCITVLPEFPVETTPAPTAEGDTPAPMEAGGAEQATPAPSRGSSSTGGSDDDSIPAPTNSPAPKNSPSPTLSPSESPATDGTPAPNSVSVPTLSPTAALDVTLAPVGTPSPSPAPTESETETIAPVPTLSPTAALDVTLAPVGTPSPSPAPTESETETIAPVTKAPSAVDASDESVALFEASKLDDDVDLSYLDPSETVVVWYSITLGNTYNVPFNLGLESGSGDFLEATITKPDEGWVTGGNTGSFNLPVGSLSEGTWTKLEGVTVVFETGGTTEATGTTTATVNWLILSHELVL